MVGGVIVGGVFLMAAAFLGADHLANPDAARRHRRAYKVLAVLATLPFFGYGLYGTLQSAVRGQWPEALAFTLKLALLGCVFALFMFDQHPRVQRFSRQLGISTPTSERNDDRAL